MSAKQAAPANPFSPELRPVGAHDLTLLVLGLAIVVAPHAMRAPWWLTLLTALLYAWRWLALRTPAILPSRWLLLVVAMVAMFGVWLEYRAIFGRTPGIVLLVLFSGLKLLEMRNQRDAVAVVYLSWFLVITNFLYSQSIPTAVAMCAALALTTWTLVGFSAPARAPRANLRSAGLLLAQAIPAALILFVLFPRVQGPLWGLPQDAYSGMSGLSDSMAPGNLSQLTMSDAVAFRVDFQGEIPPRRALYWRGPVLWDFDGRTWRIGSPGFAPPPPPRAGDGAGRIEYSVILEPHNRNWLFAIETAALVPERARMLDDGQIVTVAPVRARMRYEMASVIDAPPEQRAEPWQLRRALRLPEGYNARSTALARSWRREAGGGAADDGAILQRAIEFIRGSQLVYTLEPPLLGQDSVDEFLFQTKAGFCEHFSSAFVFLMRAAGVPARVVTGYQGGDLNPVDGRVTVRQSEAHAWSEVFLAGRGWIRIDPTALAAPGRLEAGLARAVRAAQELPFLMRPELQWLRSIRYNWEALTHQWNLWVLGYNPERQRELMSLFGMRDTDWRGLAAALMTVLGSLVVALLVWSLRRHARPDPVKLAWLAFCRKLDRKGVPRAPHEGPRDFAERAASRLPSAGEAIRHIAALYIALRYGSDSAAAQVTELRRRVREFRPA
jgi:transglutaminase-like putative cysteine protease